MKWYKGERFQQFGVIWMVTDVYPATDEEIRKEQLYYRWRFRARVLEAPWWYPGAREMDAAIPEEWARAETRPGYSRR